MSVTFSCPEAPREKRVPYPDVDPDFVDEVSELPEINLSNSNARTFIELLGLPMNSEMFGDIEPTAMDAVIGRLRSFLAVPTQRAAFLEPTTVNGRVVAVAAASSQPDDVDGEGLVARCSPRFTKALDSGGGPAIEARAAVLDALLPANRPTLGLVDRKRGKPSVIDIGRSDEYLLSRASEFLDLFTQAQALNYRICWG